MALMFRAVLAALALPFLTEAAGAAEVWIAAKSPGRPGTGTLADPFDGSSQAKFDALLSGFEENAVIHLLPGTFLTGGWGDAIGRGGFRVKSGWKLLGGGQGKTVLRLNSAFSPYPKPFRHVVIATAWGTESNGVEVADLTVDVNMGRLSLRNRLDCADGVGLAGSYNVIHRVEVIHSYGVQGGSEGFPIACGPADGMPLKPVLGNVIEDCLVHDYAEAGYDAGIAQGYAVGGIIRRNRVLGTKWLAYQYLGADGTVADNYCEGALGYASDTGPISNLQITGNTFRVTDDGIQLCPDPQYSFSGISIHDNAIFLTRKGGGGLRVFHAGKVNNLSFTGNRIDGEAAYQARVENPNCADFTVQGNRPPLPVVVMPPAGDGVAFRNLQGYFNR